MSCDEYMKNEAMRTLTASLTPKQIGRLRDAVDTGKYASNSEIVRDALWLWDEREEVRRLEIQRLKQAYDDGKASGEPRAVDVETLLAELKAES